MTRPIKIFLITALSVLMLSGCASSGNQSLKNESEFTVS